MWRLRVFILSALLTTPALWAQRQMTVPQLEQFIKSSLELKHPDKQIADVLKNVKLTQRLDTRAVENLQGMGAGPRTMEALRVLSSSTVGLPTPPPATAVAPANLLPSPSDEEKAAILAEVTRNALDYTASLPNFMCTQITRRYAGSSDRGLRLADIIQEHLSFVDGKEDYKVVMINNLVANNVSHNELGGATSSGEFGTMLHDIFKPETRADFKWERWATLRGRRSHVFAFRVAQARSDYTIYDGQSGRRITAGYHGLVYADAETRMVMRIKMDADGLENFPVNSVDLDLNYDFVEISGRKYILPFKYELNSGRIGYATRNETEFRRYERFTADAEIIYDLPDEIPEDQLEEEPIR